MDVNQINESDRKAIEMRLDDKLAIDNYASLGRLENLLISGLVLLIRQTKWELATERSEQILVANNSE